MIVALPGTVISLCIEQPHSNYILVVHSSSELLEAVTALFASLLHFVAHSEHCRWYEVLTRYDVTVYMQRWPDGCCSGLPKSAGMLRC
jgi:hypothetical protein